MSFLNLFSRKHKQHTMQPHKYERIKSELIEVRVQRFELQIAQKEFNELTGTIKILSNASLIQSAPIVLNHGMTLQDVITHKKRELRECEEKIYSLPGEPELQERENKLMKEFQNLKQ